MDAQTFTRLACEATHLADANTDTPQHERATYSQFLRDLTTTPLNDTHATSDVATELLAHAAQQVATATRRRDHLIALAAHLTPLSANQIAEAARVSRGTVNSRTRDLTPFMPPIEQAERDLDGALEDRDFTTSPACDPTRSTGIYGVAGTGKTTIATNIVRAALRRSAPPRQAVVITDPSEAYERLRDLPDVDPERLTIHPVDTAAVEQALQAVDPTLLVLDPATEVLQTLGWEALEPFVYGGQHAVVLIAPTPEFIPRQARTLLRGEILAGKGNHHLRAEVLGDQGTDFLASHVLTPGGGMYLDRGQGMFFRTYPPC